MSDASTRQTVECPICEDEFDPSVAGGWCTNTECGEWQYTETDGADEADDGFVSPVEMDGEDDTEAADGDGDGDDIVEPEEPVLEDDQQAAESEDSVQSPSDIVEMDEDDVEAEPSADASADADTDPDLDVDAQAEPESEVESKSESEDEAEDEAETEAETEPASESEDTAETDTPEPALECSDCGNELAEGANFCAECGAEVTEESSSELDACPSCAADVEPDDSFCVNCGEDLDAHRDDGTADDAVEALADDQQVPDTLVLAVEGHEITIRDGDKVGREVRAALTDAGRPEEEAVRIHREHVRFVREADSFYLLDLGDNPTALNGQSLTKGDREPVAPGDELELSGVTTVDVQAP